MKKIEQCGKVRKWMVVKKWMVIVVFLRLLKRYSTSACLNAGEIAAETVVISKQT